MLKEGMWAFSAGNDKSSGIIGKRTKQNSRYSQCEYLEEYVGKQVQMSKDTLRFNDSGKYIHEIQKVNL